jgi:hypothetical protein
MTEELNISVPALADLPLEEIDYILSEAASNLEWVIKNNWFESEGRGRWAKPWIVPGAVEDLKDSPNIKAKRFNPVSGRDTGRLNREIEVTYEDGKIKLAFGPEYAEKFHKGGQSKVMFSSAFPGNLRMWYGKNKGNKQIVKQYGLGFLFAKKAGDVLKFNQRPRPLYTPLLITQVIQSMVRSWQKGQLDKQEEMRKE